MSPSELYGEYDASTDEARAKLPSKCPRCGEPVAGEPWSVPPDPVTGSREFDCGTVLDHDPRRDRKGWLSLVAQCEGYS